MNLLDLPIHIFCTIQQVNLGLLKSTGYRANFRVLIHQNNEHTTDLMHALAYRFRCTHFPASEPRHYRMNSQEVSMR